MHLVQLYGGCSSGQKPGPTFVARGRKIGRGNALLLNTRITTPSTKKPFFSVIETPTIPPSFAPVGRCVGRTRPGRHPLPAIACLRRLSGQRGEKTRSLTPALAFLIKWQDDMRFAHNDWPHFRWRIPMFLEVNRGTKKSRRKNRRFCCADSLTTSRSAGSCGILKERCSTHEIAAMTLFSAKFGCLLRSAECRWGVPGLLRHESPFKECVAENKTRIPIRQTNCYFSDSRRRVPWLLSQHRDMLFR